MPETLTAMPTPIRAGDTIEYRRSLADYPADDGWALNVYISGAANLTKAGVADGSAFVVTLTAAETGALSAGLYQFLERASKAGAVYTTADGELSVLPNVATASPGDLVDPDVQMLADVETVIAARLANGAVDSYTIINRSVTRMSLKDLYELRKQLKNKLAGRKYSLDWMNRGARVVFTGTENEA